jgi:hypothetical protein
MGKKMIQKRYICHQCGYVGSFPISKSRNCPKCEASYMIPGDMIRRKIQIEEQEMDPFVVAKRSHKHYWVALWIMSIVLALAIAFYFFVALKPSQNISYAKAKLKLPIERIDLVDPLASSIRAFLLDHPEYGTLERTDELPDWAFGKRKTVTTSTGKYVFYFEGSKVVSVDRYLMDGEKANMFEKKQQNSE